jgi:hypothetical protein
MAEDDTISRFMSEMGRKGGKRRLKTMTAAARKAVARKAGLASAKARRKKAAGKKKPAKKGD